MNLNHYEPHPTNDSKIKKYHMDKNVKTINPHYPIFGG
jgi:hypothetical protein